MYLAGSLVFLGLICSVSQAMELRDTSPEAEHSHQKPSTLHSELCPLPGTASLLILTHPVETGSR